MSLESIVRQLNWRECQPYVFVEKALVQSGSLTPPITSQALVLSGTSCDAQPTCNIQPHHERFLSPTNDNPCTLSPFTTTLRRLRQDDCSQPRCVLYVPILARRCSTNISPIPTILTDDARSRLFAEQVPQGSLLCLLLRAPRSHVRSPLQGAP